MSKSAPGIKKSVVIWLDSENEAFGDKRKMFFCFNCRIPIIEYEGDAIQIVPGGSPYIPNTTLKCKGSVQRRDGTWENCGMYYTFAGLVHTRNPEVN